MGGGTKPSTVPQREALFWATGDKKSAVETYEWTDGGPMLVGPGPQTGPRPPDRPRSRTRASHCAATKPTTVPQGEGRSWAAGQQKSSGRTHGRTDA